MRILVIGGTGTIGSVVSDELKKQHEVIIASRKSSDIVVDITDVDSIKSMFKLVDRVDAIAITSGDVHFGALSDMTTEQYYIGLNSKLMAQINIVLHGRKYLNNVNGKASFTLISGILNHDPILYGTSAAMVNGAIDGFVRSAATELFSQNIRINVVSPTVLTESMPKYETFFPGFKSVPATDVALAFRKSIEGVQTGQVYKIGY